MVYGVSCLEFRKLKSHNELLSLPWYSTDTHVTMVQILEICHLL